MRHDKMRIVVTGAAGRLGAAMTHELARDGHTTVALNRAGLDITDAARVLETMRRLQPDAIVNCSAYNAVDAAETNPGAAFAANARGPAALTAAAADVGAVLVHYGTDFVFDGNASEPYTEDAAPGPVNVYGASKLAGEQEVRRMPRHYILRVESLFGGRDGSGQKSTVDFLADTLASGLPVRALIDRTVTPSYVEDVARATRALIEGSAPFGTYHCVASGATTWYELAQEMAAALGGVGRVVPVQASEFPTVARRPRFCALSNGKLRTVGIEMPHWRAAVRRHLESRTATQAVVPVRARTA